MQTRMGLGLGLGMTRGGGGGIVFPPNAIGAWYPFEADPDDGGIANSETTEIFPRNLFHYPDGLRTQPVGATSLFATSNCTLTYDYGAGPGSGERTLRFVATTTAGRISTFSTLDAGTYTLAMEVKAASAVSFEFGTNVSRDTIAATTSFQTVTKTIVHGGGTFQPYWAQANGVNLFDLECANFRISAGSSDLGKDAIAFPLWFGELRDDTTNPTSFADGFYTAKGFVALGAKTTITATTLMIAMQMDSGFSSVFAPFINNENTYNAGITYSSGLLRAYANNAFDQTEFSDIAGKGWLVLALKTGAGGTFLYRDGLPISASAAALSSFQTAYWSIQAGASGVGIDVGPVAIWHEELTDAQIVSATKILQDKGTEGGLTFPNRSVAYYPCGDSITTGVNSGASVVTNSYADLVFVNDSDLFGVNIAGVAHTLSIQSTRISNYLDAWTAAAAAGKTPLVSLLIGRNDNVALIADPVAYYASVKVLMDSIKATGALLVMCDILPSNISAGYNTARGIYNALLAANEGTDFDIHCDFYGVAAGQDGAELDALLYADGTHPTQAAHDQLYPVLQAALDAALALP